MPGFLDNLLRLLRGPRGSDVPFLCHKLLSERGEASQTALAQEIISAYQGMNPEKRLDFYQMLCREFQPDQALILRAAAEYQQAPGPASLAALSAAVEPPRQELFRRINTASHGTETLVGMRGDLLQVSEKRPELAGLDSDLRHLFRSWFNRGFLRLERVSWKTSARILESLIRYESVHEINGWPDLRRRLEADRRCFAFFHPALGDEPVIFLEVALTKGLPGDLEPLLDVASPLLPTDRANTAVFYSINNCLRGLRGVPFGNFLIKQVVDDLTAEFPGLNCYATLSPLPHFAEALQDSGNPDAFTRDRLRRLLADFAASLAPAAARKDPVDAFLLLLKDPVRHREALSEPLRRLALAYLTRARRDGKLYDSVAGFHLSNGARLERINPFGNLRPYGLKDSFGVTVNYRYLPEELEENHERFARQGEIQVSRGLSRDTRTVAALWKDPGKSLQGAA
ncbi:MAG TPA: malonyl-CoA decarboxylase family protein [Candidatus Acidoferrales bacterium]|nr:malonyl-CoA decarboxylase family protein [Candidatus Acidoferrales bacterium]